MSALRPLPALVSIAALALTPAASALAAVLPTTTVVTTQLPTAMTVESVRLVATVNSGSVPNGIVNFTLDSVPVPSCSNLPAVPATPTSSTSGCTLTIGAAGTHAIGASYLGDPYHAPSTGTYNQVIVPSSPGSATVSDPCNSFTVTGATQSGNLLTNFTSNTVIQLGSCISPAPFVVDFDHLNLAPGAQLSFRSGASGQRVELNATSGLNPQIVAGALRSIGATAADVPPLTVNVPHGLNIRSTGRVEGLAGVTLDLLDNSYTVGSPLDNGGVVNGGVKLDIFASDVHGGGDFDGNDLALHIFGNANNPAHGSDYLQNYLNLKPGLGVPPQAPDIHLTLNGYGPSPQVFNLKLNGSASLWMPSQWPPALQFPSNNPVIAPNQVRPAGTPEPAYGGGSMLIQATGALFLDDGGAGGTHDFVFPGAIVMISDQWIDLKGVSVNQGWTGNGQAFQGIFFKAPIIQDSSGHMNLYGNAQNWINMSTMPITPVSAFTLQVNGNGSQSFAPSDGVSTHLNDYVTISNIAVSGGCWVCAVNTAPVNMRVP